MTRFVRRVLADTEDVWDSVFQAAGKRYEKPKLVLFRGATQTGVRHRPVGDGAVLLPARQEGLHRSRVLRGAEATASRRRATSRRPT